MDHLGLVNDIVNRYLAPGIDRADLFQEGFLGLVDAIDLYKPSFGTTFSTYAYYWIRHRVSLLAFNYNRLVRIPASTRGLMREVQAGQIDQSRLTSAEKAAISIYEASIFHDKHGADKSFLVMIKGREPCPTDRATTRDTIEHLLRVLPSREREIVTRYFGLDGQPEESCKQIAASYGMTWQRIAQVLNRALYRMQSRSGINPGLRIKRR